MLRTESTIRIRQLMVAIISVILILVTTIGYIAPENVFAEGEEQTTEESAPAEGNEGADGSAEGEDKSKDGESNAEDGEAKDEEAKDGEAKEGETAKEEEAPELPVSVSTVSASSYMVMSGSTSEKVFSKNPERKMQPGKITMLVTAMVVLDNMYDDRELTNTVEIDEELAGYGTLFKQGESISVGDLLNAMLIGGDEQAAEALASYSASKRKIFVNEMNSKCMELGIMDTQFKNPSGAYKNTQYSTAADLAVITQAAFRYQHVKDALSQKSVTITATSKAGARKIDITGTDPLISGDEKTVYEFAKGGMMGTLADPVNAAQYAAVATKDDMQLIVILMDADPKRAAAEAKVLLEHGDAEVTKNTIVKKGKLVGHARVKGGALTRVAAYTETKGFAYVPPEGSESLIQTQVVMLDGLEAPLKKGDKVGEFRIYVADELKGTVDLIIKSDVATGWAPSQYYISNRAAVAIAVMLVLLLAFFIRVVQVKRRRLKRREARRRQKIRELARKQLEIDEDRKKREWSGSGYEAMPPRTTDIRREEVNKKLKNNRKKPRRKK